MKKIVGELRRDIESAKKFIMDTYKGFCFDQSTSNETWRECATMCASVVSHNIELLESMAETQEISADEKQSDFNELESIGRGLLEIRGWGIDESD